MPVVGVPEELDAVQPDAVALLGVEAVLARPLEQHVLRHQAVGAVGTEDHVLGVRARLGGGVLLLAVVQPAGVQQDVLGLDAGAVDLHVAAHAGADVGHTAAIAARCRQLLGRLGLAALEVDQVLVVRTGGLVGEARRVVAAGVLLEQARVAPGVVGRGVARLGLGVAARQDHHAVVVARALDRVVHRVGVAQLEQVLVEAEQAHPLVVAHLDPGLRGPQAILAAVAAHLVERALHGLDRGVAPRPRRRSWPGALSSDRSPQRRCWLCGAFWRSSELHAALGAVHLVRARRAAGARHARATRDGSCPARCAASAPWARRRRRRARPRCPGSDRASTTGARGGRLRTSRPPGRRGSAGR